MSIKNKLVNMYNKIINAKKGSLNMGSIWNYFYVFIGMTILFLGVAELYPTAADAGDNLSDSGIPLGSLLAGGGVVFLILAAGIVFVVIKSAGIGKK
jgi:hypothetical protein